uniref:Uncharacterized protein MANES_18G100600 n=1 Tax=Rhizophora mucronata TaxID=61149 RepID=A0A2P2J6Q8_RHIMU
MTQKSETIQKHSKRKRKETAIEQGFSFWIQIRDRSAKVAIDKKHFPKKINCGLACSKRCSKSSRKNVCHRACNACCFRCHCVPPGTYGNKSACPCYASLRTHGNKPKCP